MIKNDQGTGRSSFFLRVIMVLILMSASFWGGLYLAGKNQALGDFSRKQALYVGNIINQRAAPPDAAVGKDIDFFLFWEVWDKLKQSYVNSEELTDKKLFYGALRGLASAAGDPYTVFMDPKIYQEFEQDLTGTFEGIGAEIGIKNNILTVIAPLPDMPAEKAGIKAGDKIVTINGESTANLSVDEAVSRIRGPKGTAVKLEIFRSGAEKAEEISVIRDKIVVKSVRAEEKEGVYVVRISSFNDDTLASFNEAVRKIIVSQPAGVILDLRNNPGGYLETAVDVASEWIEDGVVVSEQYGAERKDEHLARGRARLKDFRTVVLVNQGSASASEIVAGALKDYEKAEIVGQQTFGKGSVQTLDELSDGSSLKVTVAKWLTPSGLSINEEGIAPDVLVDLNQEDYNADRDPQLAKALDIILGRFIPDPVESATSTPE